MLSICYKLSLELPTNVRWLRSTQKNINLQKESEQNSHVIEENSLYLNTKQRTRRYYNNTSNLQASSSSSQNISNDPNLGSKFNFHCKLFEIHVINFQMLLRKTRKV